MEVRFAGVMEGPTVTEEGQFTDGNTVTYTSEDIRFTVRGSTLCNCSNYPEMEKL